MKIDHGDGHIIHPYDILDDVLDLVIFTQASIYMPNNENISDDVENYFYDFFEYKLSKILMNIAIKIRILDDQMKRILKNKEYINTYNSRFICGTLNDKKEQILNGDLNLREACNKIIHCKSINTFELNSESEKQLDISFGDDNWNATLNIYQFADACFSYINNTDECVANN